MLCVSIVDLQVSTNDLKILSVTQQCSYGEYMPPAKINILRSRRKAPESFVQFHPNLDFLNTFCEFFQFQCYNRSLVDTCGQMDGQAEGRTDIKLIGTLCDHANAPKRIVVVSDGKID